MFSVSLLVVWFWIFASTSFCILSELDLLVLVLIEVASVECVLVTILFGEQGLSLFSVLDFFP